MPVSRIAGERPIGIHHRGKFCAATTSWPRSGPRFGSLAKLALISTSYKKANKPASGRAFRIGSEPCLMADVPGDDDIAGLHVGSSA